MYAKRTHFQIYSKCCFIFFIYSSVIYMHIRQCVFDLLFICICKHDECKMISRWLHYIRTCLQIDCDCFCLIKSFCYLFLVRLLVILRNVFNDIVTDSSLCTMLIIQNGHRDATIANCFRFHNSSIISFYSTRRCHMLMNRLIFTLTSHYNFLVNIVFYRKVLW